MLLSSGEEKAKVPAKPDTPSHARDARVTQHHSQPPGVHFLYISLNSQRNRAVFMSLESSFQRLSAHTNFVPFCETFLRTPFSLIFFLIASRGRFSLEGG